MAAIAQHHDTAVCCLLYYVFTRLNKSLCRTTSLLSTPRPQIATNATDSFHRLTLDALILLCPFSYFTRKTQVKRLTPLIRLCQLSPYGSVSSALIRLCQRCPSPVASASCQASRLGEARDVPLPPRRAEEFAVGILADVSRC